MRIRAAVHTSACGKQFCLSEFADILTKKISAALLYSIMIGCLVLLLQ